MSNGFAPYLLQHIQEATKGATPQFKIQPPGFSNLLFSQSPGSLKVMGANGHKKTVKVKYRQRYTKDFTDTSASCDNVNVPVWKEAEVSVGSYRQIALHFEDETIAQYIEDASAMSTVGAPPTALMAEILDAISSAADAILDGMDYDLLTLAAAVIGVNRRTGDANAATINIALDTTNNPLANGVTQILTDYKRNLMSGRPQVVGSGLFHNWMLNQPAKVADQSGVDTRIQSANFDFFYDENAASLLGTNRILVYEPNAIQIVEYMKYTGFKAGAKPGASTFMVMPLPLISNGEIIPVKFDVQVKYNDCQETFTDAYYGTQLTLEKGWNVIISKDYGLFSVPSDAYRAGDALAGNRGSLYYVITNS